MLIYVDNKPVLVEPLRVNPFGFVRLFEEGTRDFVAVLPAKFVRDQTGSLAYNGKTFRWSDPKVKATYIGSVLFMEGPHRYAYYYVQEKACWKESASVTNDDILKHIREKQANGRKL